MKSRSYLPALQIFRGIAALMVVFHHLWNEISRIFFLYNPVLARMALRCKLGVDFFFVLSGFIICYAHFSKMGNRSAAGAYVRGRIMRIYFPYLPISIVLLLAYHFLPSMVGSTREISVVRSLTLLPVPGETALTVAWTLVFEVFFYFIFLLAFLSKRLFFGALATWALLIIVADLGKWDPGIRDFFLSPYDLEFIMGVCAATMVRVWPPSRIKWLSALLLIPLTVLFLAPPMLDQRLQWGLLFTLLILLAIHSPLNKVKAGNLLMVLGNASYSIYLVHNPLISLLLRIFPGAGTLSYIITLSILVTASVCVAGVVYSRIFEQWARKRLAKIAYIGV